MRWSDGHDRPNEEAQAAFTRLHRAWWILAASALVAFLLIL